jgi:hypothetical protein
VADAAVVGLGSAARSRRFLVAGVVIVGALSLAPSRRRGLGLRPERDRGRDLPGPLGPSAEQPLGTDTLGAMCGHGSSTARAPRSSSGARHGVSLTIGMTIGLLAGYFGGLVDAVLMWIVDLFLTMPSLLLLIVLATVLLPSILTIPLVIGVTGWTTFARSVRGEVLTLRERDYVQAARALGAPDARIIARHLLPGVLRGVIILAALGMSGAIIVRGPLVPGPASAATPSGPDGERCADVHAVALRLVVVLARRSRCRHRVQPDRRPDRRARPTARMSRFGRRRPRAACGLRSAADRHPQATPRRGAPRRAASCAAPRPRTRTRRSGEGARDLRSIEQMLFNTLVDYDAGIEHRPRARGVVDDQPRRASPDLHPGATSTSHGAAVHRRRRRDSPERILKPSVHSLGAEFFQA